MKSALHPTAEQNEADDDNVHDEGEGKSGGVTAKNIIGHAQARLLGKSLLR
jgi:hypothetical protein